MILEKYKQTGFLKCRIGRIYSEGIKKKNMGIKLAIVALTITVLDLDLEP
jgi:hypothetical protein